MLNLVLGLLFAGLFLASYQSDRRRLRNGVLLAVASWFLLQAVLQFLISLNPWFEWLGLAVLVVPVLSIFVFAGFLIANGITMIRKEGPGITSFLPLAVGLAVFLAPVVAFLFVLSGQPVLAGIAALAFFLCSYLGCAFVVFLGYAVVYSKMRFSPNPAAVIVLGSGLIDGKVPPLLAARLNKALEIYDDVTPVRPVLVPSGGQGPDEPRPESTAMKEYLVAKGAAAKDVLEEDQLTPELQATFGHVTRWSADLGSSYWTRAEIFNVKGALSADDLNADVNLQTIQDAAHGPNAETCSNWKIRYSMHWDGRAGLITGTSLPFGEPTAC